MVSNSTLAAFCVDSGLHEFLLHDSAETTKTLRSYVMRFEAGRAAEVEAAKKEERELGQYWVEIEAPKVCRLRPFIVPRAS
jgi:endoribonuclease Dicer